MYRRCAALLLVLSAAAVCFALLMALIFKPREKKP